VKQRLSSRKYVESKNLDFFRMISLDIELRKLLHQFSYLEVEIGKACVSNNLSSAIIDVEVNTEKNIIQVFITSDSA
jgi:hypothetical protein